MFWFLYTAAVWIISGVVMFSYMDEKVTLNEVNMAEECQVNGRTKFAGLVIECKPLAADTEAGAKLMGKFKYWRDGK